MKMYILDNKLFFISKYFVSNISWHGKTRYYTSNDIVNNTTRELINDGSMREI